ncbi:LOW QUALITY PROTEIN: uncharacterized protein EMH_0081060 [Eimeria mitis]|uniref:Uncharacterized protein n=1 Tax=Eimeria mitis TaxID=44415 RepID=U6KHW2_9EIME|nr:LOW QUALITY PROTEIN: uncharacterized protein EMH_0081060 [Eimeria mitis]CDJ36366.1 hypothetical protein EMH_0081060 [Eimeria mitis]
MKERQQKESVKRQVHRRLRPPQKQRKDTAEVKIFGSSLMAAQAVATVIRRAARDEETFYDCIASITEYFLVVPAPWLPVFAAAASRVFFESIRGLDTAFTNSFEGVSCFLVANVLLRQTFTLPRTGATYDPPPLEPNAPEEPLAQAECVRMYLEDARRHVGSTESPAALALQRVTLRLLAAAVHGALSGPLSIEERQQQTDSGERVQQQLQQQPPIDADEMVCLLTSSFSPFFSFYPFRQMTSFPYFQGREGPLPFPCRSIAAAAAAAAAAPTADGTTAETAAEKAAETTAKTTAATGAATEAATEAATAAATAAATEAAPAAATAAATGAAPCSRYCLPPPVLVGCCTLADAAASWFSSSPRSSGSFDAYIQKLLETLLPFCVSASGATSAIKGAPSASAAGEEPQRQQQQPPALPPLLQPLLWNFGSSSDCNATVAAAAVAVLLPCSLLRVIVCAWRALSASYTKAVPSTDNPFQHLLPALLTVQRYQRQQQLQQQLHPLQQVEKEWWQGVVLERVLEVFLCSLRMLLLAPAPVEGFSSLCLRYSVEFLACQPLALSDGLAQQVKALHESDSFLSSVEGQVQQRQQQKLMLQRFFFSKEEGVQQQLLVGEISSWRWATASSLLANIIQNYGRKDRAMGTGSTSAAIRLLLRLHLESCLRGTCVVLQRLEKDLKTHICNSKETEEAATDDTAATQMERRIASAFVGLQWLWELREALLSYGDDASTPPHADRIQLTTAASS